MLVQHIVEFIEKLKKKNLTPSDITLLESLSTNFAGRSCKDVLNSDDIKFLIEVYKLRWNHIYDGIYDYTLGYSAVSKEWVKLSKKLALEADLSYLKILMYTVTNTLDPHDNSELTETETLTNFYLSAGNTTLCRKRSHCYFLLEHNLELSTLRRTKSVRSVFTLEEMSRLKRCKPFKGAFTIENSQTKTEHEYSSYYEFIRERILPNLTNSTGEIPKGLLTHLLELIESYFILKSREDFKEFKNRARGFFKRFYGCKLEDINNLYGQKVFYNNDNKYLIDVFLAIFEAKEFDLDQEMQVLAKFLFALHPVLKVRGNVFQHLYQEEEVKEPVGGNEQQQAYERCRSLLISLFVTQFQMFLLSRKTITVWDIENSIPSELFAVYTTLKQVCISSETNFVKAYADILREHINPKIEDKNWWTWFARNASINKWLNHVKNLSLSDIGGYWFEPEVILAALTIIHTYNVDFQKKIDLFLNDLISTYAQKQDNFKKQLRVNILFSRLLSSLSEPQRRNLMILMKLCTQEKAKDEFINNCTLHINKQLKLRGYVPPEPSPGSSPHFFPMPVQGNMNKANPVMDLIDSYSRKSSNSQRKKSDDIILFLLELKTPILTVAQEDESREGNDQRDPLGAPT